MSGTPSRYAVLGNPVGHSLSPRIHAAFAAATGHSLDYRAVLAPLDGFEATVRELFADPATGGANVTVPFKALALALADELDPLAQRAGAVNTLMRMPDGRLAGYNTDGLGLVADLNRLGLALAGARVGVLGAGGAARGVLQPLLDAGIEHLWLANRTLQRAVDIVQANGSARLQACTLAAVPEGLDVLINATSAGLADEVPAVDAAVARGAFCYDMLYSQQPTAFCRWALAADARTCSDGLGMLVEQAAEAFLIWRGVRPPTAPVLAALRSDAR